MKNFVFLIALVCTVFIAPAYQSEKHDSVEKINWMTWEEATTATKENPKKIFIDVYTHWCGYCKKMDRETLSDPEIIKKLNENFYSVKLNAEQREDIIYDGKTFKFIAQGRKGVHELAFALLDGNMGYPSVVYLDEDLARIMISPGYKTIPMLDKEMDFAIEEGYKTMSWDDYKMKN